MSACLRVLHQNGSTYIDFHCSHDDGHLGDCRFVNTAKVDPPEQVVETEGLTVPVAKMCGLAFLMTPEVIAGFRKLYGCKS